MNNSVIRKRLKGWLALMMAVTMLLGGSLTVFAGDRTWIKCEYGENPPGIFVNDSFLGGDTISWTEFSTGTGGFKSITILLDGVQKVHSEKGNAENHDVSSFTLEGDSSTTYRVTNVVYDKNVKKISIEIVSPAYANALNNTALNNTSKKEKTNEEIFSKKLLKGVDHAKPGDNMVIDASEWHSFRAGLLNELLAKEGVSYTFYYKYRDECFSVTVPAGTVFDESIPWYGPYKMNAMFGRTMIDESTLNAAIKK